MADKRRLFLNENLRTGGFYELCIQVCPSSDNNPIKLYADFLWAIDKVEGPFDKEFNKTALSLENWVHSGILNVDNHAIPFTTFNIREEEPVETGFNWFDISFHASAIQAVFGDEYKTWTENPITPKPIDDFFHWMISELHRIYPFQLAFIAFEGSGQYYLSDLTRKLNTWAPVRFYVGRENVMLITDENKDLVSVIE